MNSPSCPPISWGRSMSSFWGRSFISPTGHRATVEDKPEVKKAGGVYYTPTYIVDYIVKNTVGKLLPSSNSNGDALPVKSRKAVTPRQAAEIRILDPACGSGSFLLGAYQYLLDWHLDWYVDNDPAKWIKGKSPVLCQGPGGDWRLTTSERKRILLNNIYGVDIDPQAVEVTKLSLLLKVLEGENEQTLSNQLRLFRERALPDLANNIKCGNSLIGPDFYDNQQLGFFDDEERYRINVFDWQAEFPEIFTSGTPSPPAGEGRGEGGFDAVIGNPPYGAYLDDNGKMYLTTKFRHQSYQLDSYLLFLEQSVKLLLSQEGFYGMIIPNPWLTNLLQKKIRKFVVENSRIREIVHFRFPVFPKVVVDTEILILQKWSPKDWTAIITIVESLDAFLPPFKGIGIRRIEHGQQKWRDLDGGVINIFTNSSEEALAIKCSASKAPLGSLSEINVGIKPYQVGKGKPPQTREIVASRPYDSDHPIDSSYRSYLRGSDIARYKITPLKKRYLKYGPWLAEPRPAAKFNAPVKIVMRQTGDKLVAALDIEQYLCLNNMHVIVPLDSKLSCLYLLGIINSKLMNWYYQVLNPEVGEALAEIKKTNVAKLPIKSINFSDPADKARHDRMVARVEQMLSLHKKLAEAKTDHEKTNLQRQIDATDRRIDRMVYDLYELTEEEIKLVEGV